MNYSKGHSDITSSTLMKQMKLTPCYSTVGMQRIIWQGMALEAEDKPQVWKSRCGQYHQIITGHGRDLLQIRRQI